jgi:hypothetical protein
MVYRWYTKNDVISKWYTVGIPSVYFRSDCNQMVYQWYTVCYVVYKLVYQTFTIEEFVYHWYTNGRPNAYKLVY